MHSLSVKHFWSLSKLDFPPVDIFLRVDAQVVQFLVVAWTVKFGSIVVPVLAFYPDVFSVPINISAPISIGMLKD